MTRRNPLSDRTLKSIQALINEVETLDLSKHAASDLVPRVKEICQGYMWMTQKIKMSAAYRARHMADRPQSVSEVWYPPAGLVKGIGRANDVGESVLYTSSSESTAIIEMRPQAGGTLAILQMALSDPNALPHVFDIGLAETSGGGDPKVGAKGIHRTPLGSAILGSSGNQVKLGLIRTFLVRQFTRVVDPGREHEYGLALAIAKFQRAPEIDGIWYPSIAGGLKGTNAVLTADAADRLLTPYACWIVRVEKVLPDMKYLVKCICKATRIDEDGSIRW
jgi:RES domain-containing protein